MHSHKDYEIRGAFGVAETAVCVEGLSDLIHFISDYR